MEVFTLFGSEHNLTPNKQLKESRILKLHRVNSLCLKPSGFRIRIVRYDTG